MIVDSPVPDILWLRPDEEQPRGVEITYEVPTRLQEIQVNVSVPLMGGPYDRSRPIVNSVPLPEIIVMVQQLSFNEGRLKSPWWREQNASLREIDPASYIATKFTMRHLYRLVPHGIALAYEYLGRWKP